MKDQFIINDDIEVTELPWSNESAIKDYEEAKEHIKQIDAYWLEKYEQLAAKMNHDSDKLRLSPDVVALVKNHRRTRQPWIDIMMKLTCMNKGHFLVKVKNNGTD